MKRHKTSPSQTFSVKSLSITVTIRRRVIITKQLRGYKRIPFLRWKERERQNESHGYNFAKYHINETMANPKERLSRLSVLLIKYCNQSFSIELFVNLDNTKSGKAKRYALQTNKQNLVNTAQINDSRVCDRCASLKL